MLGHWVYGDEFTADFRRATANHFIRAAAARAEEILFGAEDALRNSGFIAAGERRVQCVADGGFPSKARAIHDGGAERAEVP